MMAGLHMRAGHVAKCHHCECAIYADGKTIKCCLCGEIIPKPEKKDVN